MEEQVDEKQELIDEIASCIEVKLGPWIKVACNVLGVAGLGFWFALIGHPYQRTLSALAIAFIFMLFKYNSSIDQSILPFLNSEWVGTDLLIIEEAKKKAFRELKLLRQLFPFLLPIFLLWWNIFFDPVVAMEIYEEMLCVVPAYVYNEVKGIFAFYN